MSERLHALHPGKPLVVGSDIAWFGRILDGTSQLPLADARIELVAGNPFTDHTGESSAWSAGGGLVQLWFSPERPGIARVELEGYAPGFVRLDVGHAEPAKARPVRLLPAAILELVVKDADGAPRAGLDVRVSAEPTGRVQGDAIAAFELPEPPFEGRTDSRGRCVLTGLPPAVLLSIEVFEKGQLLERGERTRLEPGELRTLERTLRARCTVLGRIQEPDGDPAENVTVWLVPDGVEGLLRGESRDELVAEARSGPDGCFTLEVPAGTWRIGPAPVQVGARSSKGPLLDIAPMATRIVIPPDQESGELTLACWRNLFVRGTVKGPEGEPVPTGYVRATCEDTRAIAAVQDGAFAIGPLPPGSYTLSAISGGDGELVESDHPIVAAGTEGVEIVLARGNPA